MIDKTFDSKISQTITNINSNINIECAIAGSMNAGS